MGFYMYHFSVHAPHNIRYGGLDPKEEFRSKYVSKSVIYVSPP